MIPCGPLSLANGIATAVDVSKCFPRMHRSPSPRQVLSPPARQVAPIPIPPRVRYLLPARQVPFPPPPPPSCSSGAFCPNPACQHVPHIPIPHVRVIFSYPASPPVSCTRYSRTSGTPYVLSPLPHVRYLPSRVSGTRLSGASYPARCRTSRALPSATAFAGPGRKPVARCGDGRSGRRSRPLSSAKFPTCAEPP